MALITSGLCALQDTIEVNRTEGARRLVRERDRSAHTWWDTREDESRPAHAHTHTHRQHTDKGSSGDESSTT